jgi:hypothetical protein
MWKKDRGFFPISDCSIAISSNIWSSCWVALRSVRDHPWMFLELLGKIEVLLVKSTL